MVKQKAEEKSEFNEIFSYLHNNILAINNSKLFAGLMIITLNIASKFVNIKLSKTVESYLKFTFSKQILVFAIAWMGTRDIYASLMLTAAFTILSDHFFNEDSTYCIVPEKYRVLSKAMDTNSDGKVSQEEVNNAIAILSKAKKEKQKQKQKESFALYHEYIQDSYKNLL